MEYFNRAINYLGEHVLRKQRQPEPDVNLADAYLNLIVRIITWEDPKLTWITFIALNMLFMFIIYYEIRFYCFLCSVALAWVLMDFHGEFCQFKQQAKVISYKHINDFMRDAVVFLQSLKRDNPSMFCSVMGVTFLLLSFIGRTIPGHLLSYLLLLALFFGPYLISLTPKEYRRKFKQAIVTLRNTDGMIAETELMPFIANKDFNEDHDPDLDSLLTDKTQDSVPNSFISGISTMPSYLDADTNCDELEEDDLLPHSHSQGALSYSAVEYSSDSDSEHRNMAFDSAHFNRDSSSEDEYTKGLKFTDATDGTTIPQLGIQQLGTSLVSMGTNLLSNVLQSVANKASGVVAPRRDSDSDFEIINSEDAEDT